MLARADRCAKFTELHFNKPAFIIPICTCSSKGGWLWHRFGPVDTHAYGLYVRVTERKDDIPRFNALHVLVKLITRSICIYFGRPKIASSLFVHLGLVLVDPPVLSHRPSLA